MTGHNAMGALAPCERWTSGGRVLVETIVIAENKRCHFACLPPWFWCASVSRRRRAQHAGASTPSLRPRLARGCVSASTLCHHENVAMPAPLGVRPRLHLSQDDSTDPSKEPNRNRELAFAPAMLLGAISRDAARLSPSLARAPASQRRRLG